MIWLSVICAALVIIIVILTVKIILIKKDIKTITREFNEKLEDDTNTLIAIDGGDKTVRYLAAYINESLKELRKQRLRFEQGDTELKNAITNISHDLRTPLTAIGGYLDLLEQEQKSDEAERYLGIIKNRAEALKQLADELFKYSVVTSPDYDSPKERLSVNAVLEESIAGYYAALRQKGIVPEIDMPNETVYCVANRAALSRIFSNLIGNAIKYSGGDLCIKLDSGGRITFSNIAPQLSEVQVSKLFDRFYTVENARKSTGLGLSIAKVLIEQMNGEISATYCQDRLTINIQLIDGRLLSDGANVVNCKYCSL